jgi:hypothetical protein
MKKISCIALALASMALAPLAHSTMSEKETAKACVDTFIAENFSGQRVTVHVNDYVPPMPLVLRSALSMQLTAVDKDSGRTLATADCRMKRGTVTVTAR